MTEEFFSLPTGDGFAIHGRVNRAESPARRAVVLCHGLAGHMYEHHYQAAKKFFTMRGYDVIRFNFYGDESDARRITDCTVALHARDIGIVLDHFAPSYKRLYVAGHSYGGLAVLLANPAQVAAASFWDATFIPFAENGLWDPHWQFNKELGEHMLDWVPLKIVIGKKFHDEQRAFTQGALTRWAGDFKKPAQVLAAGALTENLPFQQALFDSLRAEKEYKPVTGAGHVFYEDDTVFDLLENTHQWFERH